MPITVCFIFNVYKYADKVSFINLFRMELFFVIFKLRESSKITGIPNWLYQVEFESIATQQNIYTTKGCNELDVICIFYSFLSRLKKKLRFFFVVIYLWLFHKNVSTAYNLYKISI